MNISLNLLINSYQLIRQQVLCDSKILKYVLIETLQRITVFFMLFSPKLVINSCLRQQFLCIMFLKIYELKLYCELQIFAMPFGNRYNLHDLTAHQIRHIDPYWLVHNQIDCARSYIWHVVNIKHIYKIFYVQR